MHVGMYDCMRSESESELGNKLSGILRKTNKQTNMHNCVSVYVYVYEERERISVTLVTTAAHGCASDRCICARARVCSYYFANLSTVSLHLPVHTVTQTHSHTVISPCVHARVCARTISLISLRSLFISRCTP